MAQQTFAVLQRQATPAAKRPVSPSAGGTYYNCRTPTDHKHAPTHDWATQQKGWATRCMTWLGKPSTDPTRPIECVCAEFSPLVTLNIARTFVGMVPFGLAWSHVDHYLTGGGADLHEDLEAVLRTDAGVRGKIVGAIKRAPRGCVSIEQRDYAVNEHALAFGAIDRMDYQVDVPAGTVHVWFKDRYEWHPESRRVSNCVHRAAVELKDSGAADYWMIGDAVVPLSLFGTTPPAPTKAAPTAPSPPAPSTPAAAPPAAAPPAAAPPAPLGLRRMVSASATTVHRCGTHPCPSTGCEHDADEVRRGGVHVSDTGARSSAPPIVDEVLRTAGTPLPTELRSDMSARLGHNFGSVRVHADSRAAQSAEAVNAKAYTVGTHVVFGPSMPSLTSWEGRRLLAHELVHVVQGSGTSTSGTKLSVSSPADPSEREAETLSLTALEQNFGQSAGPLAPPATDPPTQVVVSGSG